ncbi:MAG: endonuclease domain-containing protein [Nodosilinea sp. WJT8-NPBG4]|nr:endonuclease domain-containing protein [Nodosilinea sp. WJT8-NPBG4]
MAKDSLRIRGTTRSIEQAARELRQNLTPAETRLWKALRGRQLNGLRFRCQHPVGRFIVDFYCPSCELVIEVDGDIHNQQEAKTYDRARTEHLQNFGYRVLRFSNAEVVDNLAVVLNRIAQVAESHPPQN